MVKRVEWAIIFIASRKYYFIRVHENLMQYRIINISNFHLDAEGNDADHSKGNSSRASVGASGI